MEKRNQSVRRRSVTKCGIISQLRAFCKEHGLKKKGKKIYLLHRVFDKVSNGSSWKDCWIYDSKPDGGGVKTRSFRECLKEYHSRTGWLDAPEQESSEQGGFQTESTFTL